MKADVFPDLAPSLAVPSWVPEPIAQYVRAKHAAEVDSVYRTVLKENGYLDDVPDDCLDWISRDLICHDMWVRTKLITEAHVQDELADITARYLPLACNGRMDKVWRYLSQQQSSGGFLHPARAPSMPTVQERQQAAMLELFKTALACQREPASTTTRGELERQRDDCFARAKELREDALIVLIPRHGNNWERYQKLMDAAQAYEDHASEISFAGALERKHDGRARWVALTISDKLRELFDSAMYGLTATITSVILGREIEPRTVQHWCHSALKASKPAP